MSLIDMLKPSTKVVEVDADDTERTLHFPHEACYSAYCSECCGCETYKEGYNKAIDDFVKLYKSKTKMEHILVDTIAEQLKEAK